MDTTAERWRWLTTAALVGHIVLALWFVERVTVNEDEGWYLYAAHRVAEGARLHRDFAFFQGPVFPHVYGGLTSPGPGSLLAGRWWSLVFLVMGTGLTALTALRVGGRRAAILALVVVGLHPLVVATGVWAKPYALGTMLLAGGLFLLAGVEGRAVRTLVGTALIAVAVGTRISLLPVLLAALVLAPGRRVAALGAVLGLSAAFHSVVGVPIDTLGFHWVGFHLGMHESMDLSGWAWTRLGLGWNAGVVFASVWGMYLLSRRWRRREQAPVVRIAEWGLLGVVLVHLLPKQTHVEHLVIAAPLMGVVVGAWGRSLPERSWTWPALAVLVALGGLGGMRWVQLDRGPSSLDQVMEVGAWLRERIPESAPLVTLETVLAVESGRRVPPGFAMGRFGWMPHMPPEDVERYRLLDEAGVEAALAGVVGGVALGPEDFAERLRARAALEAAWQRLPAHRTVPAYGQFSVPLSLGAGADPTVWVPVGAP